jgi:hypothetical protein
MKPYLHVSFFQKSLLLTTANVATRRQFQRIVDDPVKAINFATLNNCLPRFLFLTLFATNITNNLVQHAHLSLNLT